MSEAGDGPRDPKLIAAFLFVTLVWSSTWIVIKGQLGIVPPVWSVTYRFLLAGLVMMALARAARSPLAIGREGQQLALVLGLFQFVLNYNLVYAAETHISSGLAAVVFALLVVPNAIFGRLFFGARVSRRFVLGSAVAMAGVGLLFLKEWREAPAGSAAALAGLVLALLAVLAASCANVMQLLPSMRGRPIAGVLAWAMLDGGLADGVFALAMHGPPTFDPRLSYWIGLVYLGAVASALAFWLYYRIIREIGPARAAYSSVMIPIIAMGLSTAFENYHWSPLAIAGGALGLVGLLVALFGRAPSDRATGAAAPPPPDR